jgi:hypothetical protein
VLTVETPAYKPTPHELTGPIMPPPRPPAYCADSEGGPLICAVDGLATIPSYENALDLCNRDRVRAEFLGRTDGQ